MEPLKVNGIFESNERESIVHRLFSNIQDLYNINSKLLKKLQSRQKEAHVVEKIGDIFANVTNELYPYIEYGTQQVFAKSLLDELRTNNSEFAAFLKVRLGLM
jgi:RHO1 GDP-GTP exchange protein 1/2